MGNASSSEESAVSDTGIVTVTTPGRICRDQADGSPCIPEDALLQKLQQLPQVQQAIHSKSADDQVWRDLAAYSQDELQLDPAVTVNMINTYRTWCRHQADTVAKQQDFVNSRLQDVDRLVSELMEECQRKQQALERKTRLLKSLTSTQQQMEDMSGRIAACSTSIQAVKQQTSNI